MKLDALCHNRTARAAGAKGFMGVCLPRRQRLAFLRRAEERKVAPRAVLAKRESGVN